MKLIATTRWILLFAATIGWVACSKNVQKVGQRKPAPTSGSPAFKSTRPGVARGVATGAARAPTPQRKLQWEAPASWKTVKPSSRLRLAEYVLPAAGGRPPRLAVFHFPGMGGSVMANVQRWVGQFKPAADKPQKPTVSKATINGLPVTLVTHAGTYQPGTMSGGDKSPKPGHGLLAAIVTTPAGPWFFKVTGPEKAIAAQRATFDSFLKTLTLPGQPKKAEPAAKKTAAAQDTESVKQSAKKTAKKTEKAAAKVPAAAPKKAY